MHTRDIHKILLKKKVLSNKAWLILLENVFELNLQKRQRIRRIHSSMFRTARSSLFLLLFFFLTCQALETWFELSRVKLFRNDLKENNIYFELAGGSGSGKSLLRHPKLAVRWWVFSLSFVFSAMHTRPTSVIVLYTLQKIWLLCNKRPEH